MDHNFMKKNLLFHASKVKIQTKYNYSNEWQKNITNSKKNNPNFMGYILFYYLSKQKISNLNSYATFILSINLSDYSASLWNFFGDPLVCKQCTLSLVRNALNFFSHYPYMKPWHLNKSMIFRLCLLFLVFFPERPCAVLRSSFVINMLQLFISFIDTSSVFIQIHEYNFFFQRFWNFEPLIIYT